MTAKWPGGSATAKGARLVLKLPASVTMIEVAGARPGRQRRRGQAPGGADRLKPDADRDRPGALVRRPRGDRLERTRRARLLVDGKKAGARVQVAAGRKHVVEAVDTAGNRSRVTIVVSARPSDRAAEKPGAGRPRHDELWPGTGTETGCAATCSAPPSSAS